MPTYARLSIEGTLGSSPEVFSTGCAYAMGTGDFPSQAEVDAWAQACFDLLNTTNAGAVWIKNNLSTVGSITGVRIYGYTDVGTPAAVQGFGTGSSIAGSGTVSKPPQCATVVSLLTGVPGSRNRGRMYVPTLTAAVGSSMKRTDISTSTATNFAGLLVAMGNAAPDPILGVPAVVSQAAGTVTPVTQVRIGDVVDTQRRRRDALVETYYSAAISG